MTSLSRTHARRSHSAAWGVLLCTLGFLASLWTPRPAGAAVLFDAGAGFRQNGFNLLKQANEPVAVDSGEFSYGGAICPAAGTPNFLCGRVRGIAGMNGNRIVLRAEARLKRTNAGADHPELAGYGDVRVTIVSFGGSPVQTAPGAYFYFGLHGTLVNTRTNANVLTQAFASANLYADTQHAIQCFGQTCQPDEVAKVKVDNWSPASGIAVGLRSDVAMVNSQLLTGWDAEVVADFFDTVELLAIELVDANDDPIPGAALTFEVDGTEYAVASVPPTPTVTPTPTLTASPTPTVIPSATLTATATATPTATPTPACANPPCEDCENCIDDDGDTLVDRADADCTPAANGWGLGVADPTAAKPLDKCAKAVRKGGAKLQAVQSKQIGACLKSVGDCVQLKNADAGCLGKAQTTCGKARAALPAARAKIAAAVTTACGDPPVAAGDLIGTVGLGFDGEQDPCARRGVAPLATVADVVACVARQHACAAERLVGFAVPRATALLDLGGWDAAQDLSCLDGASVGGATAVAQEKTKALRKCDATIQKAAAKLVASRLKIGQACGASIFTCVQTKPADLACLTKAGSKCTKARAAEPALAAAFASVIAKACGAAPLGIADLRADAGLGLANRDADCAALGVASLATVDDVASCLTRQLTCRVDQMLENEIPRLDELLGLAGVPQP